MRNFLLFASLCTLSLLSVTNVAANTLAVARGITAIDSTGIVSFDQSSIPSVVLANFDTIQWTLSAPTGDEIAFNQNGVIGLNFDYFNGHPDSAPIEPCSVQFLNLQGPAPVFASGACGVGFAGNAFYVQTDWTTSAGTSFTGIQVDFAVGSPTVELPSDFSYRPLETVGVLTRGATLQPVPEPSSLFLLGTGLLAFAGMTWRKKLLA